MKQHLAELLILTVSKCYGDFYASIFAQLVRSGRLTFGAIASGAGRTPADVRLALVCLIQQQLILHFTDDNNITFYEPHWDRAYNLTIRSGSLIRLVEERYDARAADVFETILVAGVIRVDELVKPLRPHSAEPEKHDSPLSQKSYTNGDSTCANSVNGISNTHAHEGPARAAGLQGLYATLQLLLRSGLVESVGSRQYMPLHDLHEEAERVTMEHEFSQGVTGKKQKAEFAARVDSLRRAWRNEPHEYFYANNEASSNKRARSPDDDESTHPLKRQKINGQLPTGNSGLLCSWYGSHEDSLSDQLLLRVNFEKCNVRLRNEQLVRMAARYVGETSSKVYQALLMVLESKVIRCYDPFDPFHKSNVEEDEKDGLLSSTEDAFQPLIKTAAVAHMLDPDLDLNVGLAGEDLTNGVNGHANLTHDDANGDEMPAAGNRKPMDFSLRLHKIEQHLRILAVDPREFVRNDGRDWRVPYTSLTQTLTNIQIEDCITSRFGMLPARIIRVLSCSGNLDIAQLIDKSMVLQTDLMPSIVALTHAGLLETQEVPRDNTRSGTRMLWMYNYDVRKVRRQVLGDTYRAMARMIQRIDFERAKIAPVFDKAERTDVIGNEEKYLHPLERAQLKRWHEIEEIIFRQVQRMDDLVATLRDFSSMDTPPAPLVIDAEKPTAVIQGSQF